MGETLAAITGTPARSCSAAVRTRCSRRVARPDRRGRPGRAVLQRDQKLVVGANEPAEEWANTTRFGVYDPTAIRRLKDERDGVIYISGSGQLVRGLLRDGLVDDLHLFVYPISLGEGERFWAEGEQNKLVLRRMTSTTTASRARPGRRVPLPGHGARPAQARVDLAEALVETDGGARSDRRRPAASRDSGASSRTPSARQSPAASAA